MATSADSDSSNPIQLELPYASRRFKGSDVRALVSDTSFREWVANLWNCYQPLLLELAHFHLRDWERAQEVVQEMWVDFIKSVPRFEGRCSEKTWLVQILKRCIRKERRRTVFTRARKAVIAVANRGRDDHYGARVGLQEKWYESPEQLLLAQERLEQILRARRALPKKQAEVWILRDIFEWTSEEVSEALALTPENQRVLLHRAHQRLKAELRGYFGTAPAVQPGRTKPHDLQRS